MPKTLLKQKLFSFECLSYRFYAGLGVVLTAFFTVAPLNWAQNASQFNAGAILNQEMQNQFLRQSQPWLYRPITREDLRPERRQKDPVIELIDMDVQGKVIPSLPSVNETK